MYTHTAHSWFEQRRYKYVMYVFDGWNAIAFRNNWIWISRCDYTNRVETWEKCSLNPSRFDVSFCSRCVVVVVLWWWCCWRIHCFRSIFSHMKKESTCDYIKYRNVKRNTRLNTYGISDYGGFRKVCCFVFISSGFVGFILQSWLHHCFHHNP